MSNVPQQDIETRIEALADHLSQIRRNMEKLIAENQRMREVVRIAESELRKRRDQVRSLETDMQAVQNGRLDARARVEHAIEKLDELISEQGEAS